MKEYFFLTSLLPSLEPFQLPALHFSELAPLLKSNLTVSDYAQYKVLLTYYDIENIKALILNKPLNKWGNLNKNTLKQAIEDKIILPGYVLDFLNRYQEIKDKLTNFSCLYAAYFKHEEQLAKGFLKQYLRDQYHIRLVASALRIKHMKSDVMKAFQFEDVHDEVVRHVLAQKDTSEYTPLDRFMSWRDIFNKHYDKPFDLEKAWKQNLFYHVEELARGKIFSVDRVLSYVVRLLLIEDINRLDKQTGEIFIEKQVAKGIV